MIFKFYVSVIEEKKPEPESEPNVKVDQPVVSDEPMKVKRPDAHPQSQSHEHRVHVEEVSHDYYLPLMIGMSIGIAAVVILVGALLCICCGRKIQKRMYMAKEPEKPQLVNEVYTIGLPPPIYESNGIPHISYEEAKGQKIGTPNSSRRASDEASQRRAETSSLGGCVTDI